MQTKQSNKMRSPDRRTRRLPYLPGLDGLRALAVIAVLLYHTNLNLRGGFLGVEVFFVLSGFLITSLLLSEWRQHGRIDLRMFWLRRARRLFPALVLVLLGTTILASLLPSTEIEGLEGYLAAAFGYVMNWYLIADQQSYFTPLVRPPLLQHLWSLAIEEQFYLIWPLLLLFGMRFLRSAGLLLATLTLAAGSLALTVFFYQPGADPSRIYYGTDTRAFGLLTGAVLALLWAPAHPPFSDSRTAGLVLDILGIAALAGLIASCIWLYDQHPRLYQGGLAGVSLGTAVAIASISHPQARLISGLIGCRPLRWIGIRSYGIYLWHWPIFMLTRPGLDIPLTGWPLTVVRVGIVVALAALSYRFVEMPIRQGRFGLPAWIGRLGRRAASALRRMPGRGTAASAATIKAPIQGGRKRSAGRSPGMSMGWLYGLIIVTLPAAITACALQTSKPPNAGPIVIIPPTAITPTATPTMAAAATPIPNEMAAAATPTTSETPTAGLPSPTVAPPTPTELPAFDPALEATLQAILDQAVASGEIPGVVAAVSIPGHQPWVGASGLADVRQAQPMTPDTGIRIASLSKMFTAVVVLQLVEEGRMNLDAPIATWLPGLLPDGERITVRQLLQQTTGLYDYLEDRRFVNLAYLDPNRVWSPNELVAYAAQFPRAFEVGSEGNWDYSSTNYVILGMLVEQVTGNALAHEMRQRIFDPLQLDQTFFVPDEPIHGPMARGYSGTIDQTEVAMSFAFATANIVSTVGDLQQFAAALFNGQLLEDDSLRMMQQFVSGHGQYNMPALEYGFGLMRNQLPVGPGPDGQPRPPQASTVMGHIGGFGGFRSALWFAPESGIIIALGVNQAATDPNHMATQVLDTLLTYQGR